jgi:hypothetical protein
MKQKILNIIITSVILFGLSGCVQSNYVPTKTGLELQAIQKKEFETKYKIAFASTLSVFQDKGYIIEAADINTGLISAMSPKVKGIIVFVANTTSYTKATAFIEEMPSNKIAIRLNFVKDQKLSSSYGSESSNSVPIEDPKFYKDIFNKIDKAIFIRTSR